jgi:hypothetical protein
MDASCTRKKHELTNTNTYIQPKPLMLFSFDASLSTEPTNDAAFLLTASGIPHTSPRSACKDYTCVQLSNTSYLQLPANNYGQYPGVTIALWFKPAPESAAKSTLIEFSKGQGSDTVTLTRFESTDQLFFKVVNLASSASADIAAPGAWRAGVWTHVTWVMIPTSGAAATWHIYIDGDLSVNLPNGVYPGDVQLTENYMGKSGVSGSEGFAGFVDSVVIYPTNIQASQVKSLFTVRAMRGTTICVVTYRVYGVSQVCWAVISRVLDSHLKCIRLSDGYETCMRALSRTDVHQHTGTHAYTISMYTLDTPITK